MAFSKHVGIVFIAGYCGKAQFTGVDDIPELMVMGTRRKKAE